MLATQAQCLRHRERLQSYVDSQDDDAPRMLDFLITEEEEIIATGRSRRGGPARGEALAGGAGRRPRESRPGRIWAATAPASTQ